MHHDFNEWIFFFFFFTFGLFLSHKNRRNKITVVQDEIVQPGLSQRHVCSLQQRCSGSDTRVILLVWGQFGVYLQCNQSLTEGIVHPCSIHKGQLNS